MSSTNDGAPTHLYLVRIWKQKPEGGAPGFHGKVQHVVSGASCYFDGLSSLPEALETMMEPECEAAPSGSPGPQGGQTPAGQPELPGPNYGPNF